MTPNPHKNQLEVPGAERPSIEALDAIAAPLIKARAERKKIKAKLLELRTSMMETMKEHNCPAYSFEDGETRNNFKRTSKERLSIKSEQIITE